MVQAIQPESLCGSDARTLCKGIIEDRYPFPAYPITASFGSSTSISSFPLQIYYVTVVILDFALGRVIGIALGIIYYDHSGL